MSVSQDRRACWETAWKDYLTLADARRELFYQSPELKIILDEQVVHEWQDKHNRAIGVVYKSKYNTLLVDLVTTGSGEPFAYERLVQTSVGKGVVAIPVFNGRFVLLRQYRHAMRHHQYSFPRGYGEDGLSGVENVKKELKEELHAQLGAVENLGNVVANSGISGDQVEVLLCELLSYEAAVGHEEIAGSVELTKEELRQWIVEGKIDDGFTLSACTLLAARGNLFA